MKTGSDKEASRAPAETYRVIAMTVIQIASAINAGMGKSPIMTPKLVETPFPPLPRRNTEKLCPRIDAIPTAIS